MKTSVICCGLLCAVLLSWIDLSASECCHVPLKCDEGSKSVERCYDCTESTVYCGKGKCNIFGCNCDGGCRQGDSSLWCWNISSKCKGKFFYSEKKSLADFTLDFVDGSQVTAKEVFKKIDKNSDGKLSLYEAKLHLSKSGQNVNIEQEFNKMDSNRDNFLTVDEIDN